MSHRQRQDIQSQTKNIVYNVYTYFKKLSKDSSHPEVAKFFIRAQQKTSEACGISLKTIQRITSEAAKAPENSEHGPCFSSPRKTYKRIKYATDIDDYDKDVLRRTVHEFYDQGEFPTSAKVLSKYQEKTGYKGSKTSMRRILKSLKFSYKKCIDGRRFLMEHNDIIDMRVQFLKKMINFRQNNDARQIVYLDKLKIPTNKENQLIIYHAGSSTYGFVKDSRLVFSCKPDSSEDYHIQMNSAVIKDWFIKILQNLKEPSIIVMDNAWYNWVHIHSKNYPKSNESKIKIQKWLRVKGVEFSSLETSQELFERVKQVISKEKKNKLNEIALSMGCELVQIPPYHYQYNPMKTCIWTQVKHKFVVQNTTINVEDIKKSVYEALDSVTIDEWKSYVTVCHRLQHDDCVKEGLRGKILKSIITTTDDNCSNESKD